MDAMCGCSRWFSLSDAWFMAARQSLVRLVSALLHSPPFPMSSATFYDRYQQNIPTEALLIEMNDWQY
jgi:hypothetical protein